MCLGIRLACKCRLDASICNNKQIWNEDKCRCECKELTDKGSCDDGFILNPSIVIVNVINHTTLVNTWIL